MVINTINGSNYAYGRPITPRNIRRLWERVVNGVCENEAHKGKLYRDGMVYIGNSTKIIHTPASPEQLPGLDYEPLGAVAAHNVSPDAHTALFAAVNARLATAEAEIAGIKHNLYDPITGNPHTYTFDSLTGIKVVSGVWNKPQARLEC